MIFFQDNREKSIESLEFLFFLGEIYFSLLKKNDTENSLTQDFIDAIGKNYYWQSYKTRDYVTSLNDYVFWKSSKFYLENLKKFASHKLSGAEFVDRILFKILNDKQESNLLQKNFKKQKELELNPKIFQFSTIISNLDLALEAFNEEKELDDSIHLTEDQLRQIVKNILPKVEKYFIDEI